MEQVSIKADVVKKEERKPKPQPKEKQQMVWQPKNTSAVIKEEVKAVE